MPARAAEPQALENYGDAYQTRQIEKYRARAANHWSTRIDLAFRLAEAHASPRLGARPPAEVRVLDVGCSIGVFAIEFARRGHDALGVDFDESAITAARRLAEEEGVAARFECCDVADLTDDGDRGGAFDIAVCFDIFEHLLDDQMGALLCSLKRVLSPQGCVLFHTFPTQHDYLFYEHEGRLAKGLEPFTGLGPDAFERLTRAYASLHDAWRVLGEGQTRAEASETWSHCNPTTQRRLAGILDRAGYETLQIETDQLYPYQEEQMRQFEGQPVANRNLFGAAAPRH